MPGKKITASSRILKRFKIPKASAKTPKKEILSLLQKRNLKKALLGREDICWKEIGVIERPVKTGKLTDGQIVLRTIKYSYMGGSLGSSSREINVLGVISKRKFEPLFLGTPRQELSRIEDANPEKLNKVLDQFRNPKKHVKKPKNEKVEVKDKIAVVKTRKGWVSNLA